MSETTTGSVKCSVCGASFNSVEERDKHNEQRHPEEAARLKGQRS